jgi:hypothetical protein
MNFSTCLLLKVFRSGDIMYLPMVDGPFLDYGLIEVNQRNMIIWVIPKTTFREIIDGDAPFDAPENVSRGRY